MSLNYDPGSAVGFNETWDTTFLSDRDVSSQVPINFVPHPAVYLSKACFGQNRYEDNAAETCLSNLLASQIRRYVIDVYWDTTNNRFNLCPVELPRSSGNSSQVAAANADVTASPRAFNTPNARQANTTTVANSTSSVVVSSTTTSTPSPTIVSSNSDTQVYQLGPYQCSDTLTLASITAVFSDYLKETANTIDGKVLSWILNLHLASTYGAPATVRDEIPAAQLPNTTTSIRAYLDDVSDVLYTPVTLLSDRSNLNSSWYRRGQQDELPLANYFTTYALPNGDIATNDGWPDENYIQLVKGARLLVGFGNIDSGLSGYNTSMDSDRVYAPGYIYSLRGVSIGLNGELATGCYYDVDNFAVDQVNNSWAIAPINSVNPPTLGDVADNLTTCGISQLLNVTIDGATADQNAAPYQDFGSNAIFSWAYGQPQNDTSNNDDFRCALMVANDDYRGHWRVEYCDRYYRVACKEPGSPYRWRLSTHSVPFRLADEVCAGDTTFEVPRTGLENTYLYNRVLTDARDDAGLLNGVWIDFNSLSVESCWVTTGLNGTCPYYQDSSARRSRQILIPTIAALIVLILTVFTILAKCGSNARNSRIRRRGEGGWDYEGVPS
ncbi:Maintenance of telomere capping protein 6 [Lithohypha guttulata]|uniref:Maintenance of telomere capping protein 6 n=1 Tax=Lithohypha guttulata TaxID=1690604 RepID=UPI00315DB75B